MICPLFVLQGFPGTIGSSGPQGDQGRDVSLRQSCCTPVADRFLSTIHRELKGTEERREIWVKPEGRETQEKKEQRAPKETPEQG